MLRLLLSLLPPLLLLPLLRCTIATQMRLLPLLLL
jgi:hypothetical protein